MDCPDPLRATLPRLADRAGSIGRGKESVDLDKGEGVILSP